MEGGVVSQAAVAVRERNAGGEGFEDDGRGVGNGVGFLHVDLVVLVNSLPPHICTHKNKINKTSN